LKIGPQGRTKITQTKKRGNCDALQLEAARRHASPFPL